MIHDELEGIYFVAQMFSYVQFHDFSLIRHRS